MVGHFRGGGKRRDQLSELMLRYTLQRLATFGLRVGLVMVFVVALIEFSFGVLGGSEKHVWQIESYRLHGGALIGSGESWWEVVTLRTWNSLKVLLVAFGGALIVGYSWGILAARFRRWRLTGIFSFPMSAIACAPGFWVVVGVAVYSLGQWQRPGFADEVVVESGPDLMSWWYAVVVALPLLTVASAWLLRAVSRAVGDEFQQPYVKGLVAGGHRNEGIFYGNILRRSRLNLLKLLDQVLPSLVGGLVIVEWAFRYEGIGSLFVDSVRESSYLGIMLSCFWCAVLIGSASCLREIIVKFAEEERNA
ncbi:MAG: ABC transporter permease subunit [Verrucomicrobiota bacterium]